MQDIIDLERRITAALERIGKSVKDRPVSSPDAGAATAPGGGLQDLLDEERMANAQLQERLRILIDREAALAAELADLTARNDALTRDLAALQAERQAESSQITDIVAALNPLIEEARHA